ncbi:MAG: NPCBM/NEW2 domain-containing protein [Armatimonadetes bacterium]|nr:NPCBM/NEW2 domain-containing protein [Armatimonadota bacterium]
MILPTFAFLACTACQNVPNFLKWALKPPMGWNSWDCYGTSITEEQFRANVEVMSEKLKPHGWQYAVVDIQWYEPNAKGFDYNPKAVLTLDANGRLLPAPNRFPSAAEGQGFKPLADWVHRQGLKFGIHLMRGIPRQAVEKDLPILGTKFKASEIADKEHVCPWNPDMYGVDMSKPGAQAYYNSVFDLIASWGVDFVKVDDLSRPYLQNIPEVEAIRKAIDQTHRKIVLSLSPGETDIQGAQHVITHANMWRISDDFWDSWPALLEQFDRLVKWNQYRGPGHYPDADMLPLGSLQLDTRKTNFTKEEQYTLMTLWAIAKSPLMLGANMTKLDPFTESLLTNDAVLDVNQNSVDNHPFYSQDKIVAWTAIDPKTKDHFVAIFNAQDRFDPARGELISEGPVINRETPGQGAKVLANLEGFSAMALVFTDGGDGNRWDHGVWVDPVVDLGENIQLHLAKTKWDTAQVGYGQISTTAAVGEKPLAVAGNPVTEGIFAHAPSIVTFDLPKDAETFSAFAALNDTAMPEKEGGTIQPLVFGFKKGGPHERDSYDMNFDLSAVGGAAGKKVTDLWTGKTWTLTTKTTHLDIPWHGCVLLRISK